jgi:site-specific DNA recombinase
LCAGIFFRPLKAMQKEDHNSLRYVLYARRSIVANKTEEDKGVPSIDSQRTEVREMAAREDRKIVKEFTETISASEPGQRSGFAEMIEYIKSGKANAIICFKMDRLARNSVDEGVIKHLLQKGVIKNIRSTDREWTSDDHTLIWSVEFGTSTQYSRDLKKHIKRGQNEALRRGFRPSIAPIGYKNSKYREQGKEEEVLVDEENAAILRKMFKYVLSGEYTPFQVLKVAQDEWGFRSRKTRRYPNGRPPSKASWYNILSNPFYYGEFEYPVGSGNWIKGKHRPLITRAEFDVIQQILHKDAPRPKTHTHAYVGLMRCGECGARITCEAKTKRQKNGNVHHYSYYHCTGQVEPDCVQKSIRQEELEEQLLGFLSSIKISPSFHSWAIEELKREYEQEKKDKNTVLYAQHREYTKVKNMLDQLFQMRLAGDIGSDKYQEEKTRLELEERRLAGQLEAIDARVQNWIYDAERLMTFAERAVEEFKNGSVEKKRSIFAALGTEHQLLDKKLAIQTEKPLLVVQEMVSVAYGLRKPLEPAIFLVAYGPYGEILTPSTRLWRWRESNPRATEARGCVYEA